MANGKRLVRSNDQWIAGVLAGIAEYFGWDPALVRIGFLFLSLFTSGFPGLLVYLILWACMPKK